MRFLITVERRHGLGWEYAPYKWTVEGENEVEWGCTWTKWTAIMAAKKYIRKLTRPKRIKVVYRATVDSPKPTTEGERHGNV